MHLQTRGFERIAAGGHAEFMMRCLLTSQSWFAEKRAHHQRAARITKIHIQPSRKVLGHFEPEPAPYLATDEAGCPVVRVAMLQRRGYGRRNLLGRPMTGCAHRLLDHRSQNPDSAAEVDREAFDLARERPARERVALPRRGAHSQDCADDRL